MIRPTRRNIRRQLVKAYVRIPTKSAGDSDDPGHPVDLALVST
jgi:hypothetical protein